MKIKPNQEFKHEKKTYKKGRSYDVSDEEGQYFISAGWVGDQPAPTSHDLEIQDAHMGHEGRIN